MTDNSLTGMFKSMLSDVAKGIYVLILAFVLGVIIRVWLFNLPILATMACVMLAAVVQVLMRKFGEGFWAIFSWIRFACITALFLVAFVGLNFVLHQLFGLYDVDAYTAVKSSGGVTDILLGHEAPQIILVEIVMLGGLGIILYGCFQRKLWAKCLMGVIVAFILMAVAYPEWKVSLPAKRASQGKSLAEKGIVKTVFGSDGPSAGEYPGYRDFHAEKDEPEDHTEDPAEVVMIHLKDHGFHGPIKLSRYWKTFEVVHSREEGDWVSPWCNGQPKPKKIFPAYEDFHGDFNGCEGPQDPSVTFFAQGSGTITFRKLN